MESEETIERQIEKLAFEADQALDPSANGLLDHGDYCDLVARLLAVTRMLAAENEVLKRPSPARTSDPVPDTAPVPSSMLHYLSRQPA